jgi:hypothetical protein
VFDGFCETNERTEYVDLFPQPVLNTSVPLPRHQGLAVYNNGYGDFNLAFDNPPKSSMPEVDITKLIKEDYNSLSFVNVVHPFNAEK